MSKALRRKTDARCPLERLTTEQRQELFMRGLQADIARGCAYFWRKRDMPEPSLAGEYPGKSVQASPAQPQAQETACQQDSTGGRMGKN